MASQKFQVGPDDEPQAILAALRRWLPGESWSNVRRLLHARRITINGVLCVDEGRRVLAGETVEITDQPQPPPPTDADVRIRAVDHDIVVVEKPPRMASVRHVAERKWPITRKQLQPTLDEAVTRRVRAREAKHRAARGSKKKRGRPLRLYSVHRIDRDTSGLVVFARTVQAKERLTEQFSQHTVDRLYLAVIHGRLMEPRRIESDLVRDRGDGLRGSAPEGLPGKHAVTHVKPLEVFGDATLVECRLETGRTHQIRIHLAEAGHPVFGDTKYGSTAEPTGRKHPPVPRLALHAAELGFTHPTTGIRVHFTMPLPADLAEFVEKLK